MTMRFSLALSIIFAAQTLLFAQENPSNSKSQSPPAKPSAEQVEQAKDATHRQFGEGFILVANAEPPILKGDFDGDGVEDAPFVATSTKLPHEGTAPGDRMIDPYDDSFGYAN